MLKLQPGFQLVGPKHLWYRSSWNVNRLAWQKRKQGDYYKYNNIYSSHKSFLYKLVRTLHFYIYSSMLCTLKRSFLQTNIKPRPYYDVLCPILRTGARQLTNAGAFPFLLAITLSLRGAISFRWTRIDLSKTSCIYKQLKIGRSTDA